MRVYPEESLGVVMTSITIGNLTYYDTRPKMRTEMVAAYPT